MSKILRKFRTHLFVKRKLSYKDLREFGAKFKTDEKTLIIYIEFPYKDLIPNNDILPHYENDTHRYYPLLEEIPDNTYPVIVCTGLLEHMYDQLRLVKECHRILKPGGRLYLSVSAVFSVHRGPEDFYHLTQYGAKHLFEQLPWANLDIKGSCQPFRTTGILLQRILLQAQVRGFVRPFIELLAFIMPLFDAAIVKQYDGRKLKDERQIDSMMPSNVQIIATK